MKKRESQNLFRWSVLLVGMIFVFSPPQAGGYCFSPHRHFPHDTHGHLYSSHSSIEDACVNGIEGHHLKSHSLCRDSDRQNCVRVAVVLNLRAGSGQSLFSAVPMVLDSELVVNDPSGSFSNHPSFLPPHLPVLRTIVLLV
ncbi:MAG: hypothetical protein JXA82_07620 [Sedimentisphaerales bacterium]|nr:hypothetical protein [Sedimentisphaerales bacterium]